MTWRRIPEIRQAYFAFLERSSCRERRFKQGIVLSTAGVVVGILWASPWGRYGAAEAAAAARGIVRMALGLPEPRSEVDDAWRRYRMLGIETSRRGLERVYAEVDPPMKRLIDYAGLDPGHGLLRWGNYNLTLLLPSTVFEPDDEGRSYRLRPLTRSIWLRNLTIKKDALMFFLVPDGPGLDEAIRGTPAIPVETSRQSTNSWGLRGPEPDPEAPLRGIVLGDSYMQGMFIGDDETPPECLRRYLARELGTRVSVLNTGVLGYSPEQYYYSLMEFADRFRPQFVIISVFTNDFGDLHEVATRGKADWDEGKYWLNRIIDYCRGHQLPHVVVPVPYRPSMMGKPRRAYYPGMIGNILEDSGLVFLDPTDAFINAFLERFDGAPRGRPDPALALFNDAIGDGHFSAVGSEVWARTVGHRLTLLMKKQGVLPRPSTRLPHENATNPKDAPAPTAPPPAAGLDIRRSGATP